MSSRRGDIFFSILQQVCLYSLWMGIRLPLPGQSQIGGSGLLVRDGGCAGGLHNPITDFISSTVCRAELQ